MAVRIAQNASVSDAASLAENASVWDFSQIRENASIGENTIVGSFVYIDANVQIGKNCKIQNRALLYDPAIIHDGVFIGPGAILTNDKNPRSISFANGLDEIASSKNSDSQVAFVVQSAWDYEAIFSTIKQLRGREDTRPYFLLLAKKFQESNDPILPTFNEWSKVGVVGDLYSPLSNLESDKQIICYYSETVFSFEKQCDRNIVIKWLP